MMNPRNIVGGLALLFFGLAVPLCGVGENGASPAAPGPGGSTTAPEYPRFGSFEALVFDREYLQDVKVEEGRIYLKRQPDHRMEAIVLRNSMANRDAYRKWFNGETDLVSPANAGHRVDAWTDWVETTANYVEYWIGDRLVLHLHRVER